MKSSKPNFDSAAHKIRMECVDNLWSNYYKIFSKEYENKELREQLGVESFDRRGLKKLQTSMKKFCFFTVGTFLKAKHDKVAGLLSPNPSSSNNVKATMKNWLLNELITDFKTLTGVHAPSQSVGSQKTLHDMKAMMERNGQS
jgi:hypothetical protein